ncbi:MAG: hypothetical protein GX295_02005 [Syntrophomonadaceae bacterium]|nr:hypothetical protein [Syntrophomonadaceae bacterium]
MTKRSRNRFRRQPGVPKHLLRSLAQDLVTMMENEENYPLALELIDQLPTELQTVFLENLSSVRQVELARFFWLIADEFEDEVQKAAQRALEKYRLAGLSVDEWKIVRPPFPQKLFMALASRTRLLGQVSLVMAWEQPKNMLDVWYFILKYDPRGIMRYLRVMNLSKEGFLEEHDPEETGIVEISFAEARHLLLEAYQHNLAGGIPAARPISQYRDWLVGESELQPEEIEALTFKLSDKKLKPQHAVNAFFVAMRNGDWGLIYDLASRNSVVRRQPRKEYVMQHLNQDDYREIFFLQSNIESQLVQRKNAELQACLTINEEEQVEEHKYKFNLTTEGSGWKIRQVKKIGSRELDEDDPYNPVNYEVYCALYEVVDDKEVQKFLDELPEVELYTELETGLHYRWPRYRDLLEEGIDVASSIFGEFILTDNELLINSRDRRDVDAICSLLEEQVTGAVRYQQQYYVDIDLVYTILSGEFSNFEELLGELAIEENEEKSPVMVATYKVGNLNPVLKRIRSFLVFEFDTPEGVKTFYEFEQIRTKAEGGELGEGFIAEYRVTPEYLTVATFGREYLHMVCDELERGLHRNLTMIEVGEKSEDLSLLAAVGKTQLPKDDLLRWQKEELRRWLETKLPALEGMTPRQARRSIRGQQLLWSLFKHMKSLQQDLRRKGLNPPIDYRAYIRAIGNSER